MGQCKGVVFIGGAHAVGKTFLCRRLAYKHSWMVSKQRHVLIEIGISLGLSWEQIALEHDKYIREVGKIIVKRFRESTSPVLLIDCHYAIRAEKALRLNGRKADEEYIHDLDLDLVYILKHQFNTMFVLVTVEPLAAASRFRDRSENFADIDHTFYGSIKQSEAEKEFFYRIINRFQVQPDHILIADNSHEDHCATERIEDFLFQQQIFP